ncbi:hypothetical protein ABIB57_003614 [Devosia sp. UYZn731]|uniref:hypothetical protein n=1 Tax=Devosia sp. UYZn731 TaxID=3156345 RepID=UPI00339B4652
MLPTDLPPVALIALGVTLAIIFAINRFGFMQGRAGAPAASAGAAQVAAVIVDPTALNHATAAVEGLTMAVTESNVIARQHARATDRLAEQVESLGEGVDRLRDEVIRSAAKMK